MSAINLDDLRKNAGGDQSDQLYAIALALVGDAESLRELNNRERLRTGIE